MGHLLNSKIGKKALLKLISITINSKGSTVVSNEHSEARLAICKACPHYGRTPKDIRLDGADPENGDFVLVEFEGCTLCTCPAASKVISDIIMREKEYLSKPLTRKEIQKRIFVNGRNLYPDKNKCSDPDLDRWAEADKKYFNN